jgi:hypothetical protein
MYLRKDEQQATGVVDTLLLCSDLIALDRDRVADAGAAAPTLEAAIQRAQTGRVLRPQTTSTDLHSSA